MLNDENPRYKVLANEQFCGCGVNYPKCKEDCYWYGEWQDMGAHVSYCKRKGADFIEPKDCENCKQYHSKYKPTNADKIRQMSDEELAELLQWYACTVCPIHCDGRMEVGGDKCKYYWLDWLKQEVESDA